MPDKVTLKLFHCAMSNLCRDYFFKLPTTETQEQKTKHRERLPPNQHSCSRVTAPLVGGVTFRLLTGHLSLLHIHHLTLLLRPRINYSGKTCPRPAPLMDSSIPSSLLNPACIFCAPCFKSTAAGKSYSSVIHFGIQYRG